jgi:parvulin-like peptidyl-prolyl isomerase
MSEIFTEPQILELGSRRLWVQLLRSRLLEEASAGFEPKAEDVENAWASFCKRYQLSQENPSTVPPDFKGCPPAMLKLIVEREVRIGKWKKALFEPEAAEHFQRRKPALDRVVYSLLRVKEAGLARELWFRIKEGEASFADLAPDYASGNEVYTAGIVGPVTFGAMHPSLAGVLKSARAGELLKPFAIAEWFLVARVNHHLPAEFDEAMKHQMIEELATHWLDERTHGRPTA